MNADLMRAGSTLAEMMPKSRGAESAIVRVGTVSAVHGAGGYLTVDVDMSGGTLTGIQATRDCANAHVGDRCVVETYAHVSIATGILARPGAGDPLFSWSSTWSGTPGNEPSDGFAEKTQSLTVGGLIMCEVAAAVNGTGEYGMAFEFRDADGKIAAYWNATSPQKNGGTLRWVTTGTVLLPYDTYTVRLLTYHWGSMTIIGTDSSGNSRKWRDSVWGTDGVPRYARLYHL
ncbi:hypothetical protein [Bifidobacterium platyrrhinorum]|uniref:Uncharacterized protein n=1 Tax=Bifidobacterium platyrrhinorum TaxID=2661628 RepID=A0A6L9STX8_9BIFI|nr:hypothetical protein [Bifidobacterium platyrrhinorum]NEG55475.1 hypothetical protein [Bifidobacterium platyrrhinorum]